MLGTDEKMRSGSFLLTTTARASFPLDKVGEAIDSYVKNMSAGKALLGPFLSQAVTSSVLNLLKHSLVEMIWLFSLL